MIAPEYSVAETLIRVRDVNLSFGEKVVLRSVNAEIRDLVRAGLTQGQVVGLLGPSGVGKSQLCRIMAGLQQPTSGDVLLNSTAEPVRRGMVGFVTQNYLLFPNRTALSNLTVAARQTGCSKAAAKEKALGMLERFGLTEHRNHYPCQLSGGQRQRVAIAQQLLCSSHFLVMDEPFSGLDVIAKDRVCRLVQEVANSDDLNTIIVVSHDIASTAAISDTLWLVGRTEGVEGACIQKVYDLAAMGLAWQPDLVGSARFSAFVAEVTAEFRNL